MYLTRLLLNPRARAVQRDLADCQGLHRTLMRGFADEAGTDARARFGLLFRIEPEHPDGAVAVLVQSQAMPDWARLPEGYLLARPDHPKDVGAHYAGVRTGMRLRFRLLANPTKR